MRTFWVLLILDPQWTLGMSPVLGDWPREAHALLAAGARCPLSTGTALPGRAHPAAHFSVPTSRKGAVERSPGEPPGGAHAPRSGHSSFKGMGAEGPRQRPLQPPPQRVAEKPSLGAAAARTCGD